MAVETFVVSLGKPTIEKDPNNVLDYSVSFAAWLARCNDTIASVSALAAGGVTVDQVTYDSNTVTVWVSGGTVGTKGSVRVRIVTVGAGARPRTKDQTVYFKIKEK